GEFAHLHSPHVPSPDARGQLKLRSSAKNRPRLLNVRQELRLWAPLETRATLNTPPHERVRVDAGALSAVGGSEAMIGRGAEDEISRNLGRLSTVGPVTGVTGFSFLACSDPPPQRETRLGGVTSSRHQLATLPRPTP